MATQTGYKASELGIIPQDWEVVELGEVCNYIGSGTTSTKGAGNFLLYGSTGIIGTCEYAKYAGDAILVARVGANAGQVSSVSGRYGVSDNTIIIQVKNPINYFFIKNILQFRNLNTLIFGSGQPLITGTQLKNFKIAIPKSTIEQTAIATALSDTDALISSLQTLIAKKKAIKLSAMQNLLSGKIRLPEFAQRPDGSPKPTRQTELGLLPEDWEVVELGEVAEIQRGASPRPIDSPIWFSQSSNIGWLRISDVTKSEKYLYNTTQNLSEEGIKNSRYIAKDNLIMSICATVGKPIINKKNICVHDGFVVFGNPKFDIEFMFYVLQEYESKWINQGQTGSQMNLNTDLIKNKIVCLPPLPEQTAIAQLLSDMDAEIEALEGRLKKTQSLKQGMMQALLSGKIRLPLK